MEGGRQVCETTGTNNKRLARKILDLKRTEIAEGRYVSLIKTNVPTLKDYCEEYLNGRTDLSPSTSERYGFSKDNLAKFFGAALLSGITESAIEGYKQAQLKAGLRAAGINRNMSFLRLVLKKAKKERFIAQNPLEGDDLFMNERKERLQAKPFTLDEEQKLLGVAHGYLRPLILLLVDSGLRVAKEGLSLRWVDLDLNGENPVVFVRASKTAAGIRSIPLTARLRTELVQWKKLTGPSVSPFVFFNPNDPTKHLQAVRKTWATALKQAGVEPRRIYDLRSTFATRLNAAGVPPAFVEQMMGHAGGLAQTYAKANEEYRRAAIEKLEELITSEEIEKADKNPKGSRESDSATLAPETNRKPKSAAAVIQFPGNKLQSA